MDNNQEKETKKNPTEGMVGIRKTLRDMGFSDGEIGYNQDTNTVTLGGRNLMTPGYLDGEAGVSYAKASDIQRSVVDLYKNTQNPVVRVSDAYAAAAASHGLSADALTYGNGSVLVGGKPISILYIDDEGKAWARQSAVDNAVAGYLEQTEVQSPNDLAARYEKEYLSGAETVLNRLMRQEEFAYDPETDPVYQAYRSKYQLEGERAGREAVADMAALTGGYASSAAVTAGAQARQYYAKQMTDVIPELAQQAFERYIEKYQADLDLVGEMVNLYDTAYRNAASANTTQRENANAASRSNVERDEQAWERSWQEIQNGQKYDLAKGEAEWDDVLNTLEVARRMLQNEGLSLSNQESETYLAYYEQLLREELSGMRLDNREAEIYLSYYGPLLAKQLWK